MAFLLEEDYESGVKIKVIGIGGGGNNAINRMISVGVQGVEFVAINTDKQALGQSVAPQKIVIGEKVTRGHGAGANPEIGFNSAMENMGEIKEMINGAHMVFLTAGMGGGTGTGAAPIIAKTAKEAGILTVAIVTTPFKFEGKKRMDQAEIGIKELYPHVDSLIIIPNERLKAVYPDTKITFLNAFEMVDEVLRQGVQSVTDVINDAQLINLDFADITTIMENAGKAHMGIGKGKGKVMSHYLHYTLHKMQLILWNYLSQ